MPPEHFVTLSPSVVMTNNMLFTVNVFFFHCVTSTVSIQHYFPTHVSEAERGGGAFLTFAQTRKPAVTQKYRQAQP